MAKNTPKRKRSIKAVVEEASAVALPPKRMSDEPIARKGKWTNKQRVLLFACRGITHRDRHLMEDLKKLMPHHKPESKMEKSKTLEIVNEMCDLKNCNKAILIEGRRSRDTYMWLSNVPQGPSVKCLVENVHTMGELKLTGNCLRGSRPLLSFDPQFIEKPHYALLKELLTQIFCVPNHHPKSQPFFDHIYTFTILDNRIWVRNYQILNDEGSLAEIGPRFVLNPVKIFSGSFVGNALWENAHYVSPACHRRQLKLNAKNKYVMRKEQQLHAATSKPKESYKLTPLEEIFKGDPYECAKDLHVELQNGVAEKVRKYETKSNRLRAKKKSETSDSKALIPAKKRKVQKVETWDRKRKAKEEVATNDDGTDEEMKINIANTKKALENIEEIIKKEEVADSPKKKKMKFTATKKIATKISIVVKSKLSSRK